MTDTDRSESELFTATNVGAPAIAPDQPDSALLALESQFNALAAELAAARGTQGEFAICRHQPPEWNEQADVNA